MSMAQILRLKPAFTDEQAQALAGLFDEEVATRVDLEQAKVELRHDIEALSIKLDRTKAELQAEIEKLRLEVQRDLKELEARLVIWVVGQGAATIGILFALLHFFDK